MKETKAWEETDSTAMVSFVLETGRRIGLQYHSLLSFDVIEETILLTFSGCVLTLTFLFAARGNHCVRPLLATS